MRSILGTIQFPDSQSEKRDFSLKHDVWGGVVNYNDIHKNSRGYTFLIRLPPDISLLKYHKVKVGVGGKVKLWNEAIMNLHQIHGRKTLLQALHLWYKSLTYHCNWFLGTGNSHAHEYWSEQQCHLHFFAWNSWL